LCLGFRTNPLRGLPESIPDTLAICSRVTRDSSITDCGRVADVSVPAERRDEDQTRFPLVFGIQQDLRTFAAREARE
jgi:hypothetical protein